MTFYLKHLHLSSSHIVRIDLVIRKIGRNFFTFLFIAKARAIVKAFTTPTLIPEAIRVASVGILQDTAQRDAKHLISNLHTVRIFRKINRIKKR
jgi:hypothetical protein